LIDVSRAVARRFLDPSVHFTSQGRNRVLQELVEAWLQSCADPRAPTVSELEALLTSAPELRDAYDVVVESDTWSLRARPPSRPLQREDWSKGAWRFIILVDGWRHLFRVTGPEFPALTALLEHLNGTHTARQLGALFPEHRPLIKRFLAFARKHRLLTPVRRAPARARRARPGVEFISHSSLQFIGKEANIMVDPCFLLSGNLTTSSRDRRRFDAKCRQLDGVSAVLITHAHWDHAHLPTLLRFRRDIPIFVPKVTKETYYNPALAPLLRSLGFTDVREVTLWKPERIGDATFTPIPFFGEWFGPGSSFDAFCYLLEVNGVRYLGTVDSERSELGNMDRVFEEVRERIGPVDCVFFCSSGQTHPNPVLCGAPAQYSNGFGAHAELMRYHPTTDAIVRWCRALEPRVVIPYAEFIFSATPPRPPVGLAHFDAKAHFRDYWGHIEARASDAEPGLFEWKRALGKLPPRLPKGTQLLMMAPGERLSA
jgi:L-ascorbate metabolism protein UlaG (beta-lactamase superfamily)